MTVRRRSAALVGSAALVLALPGSALAITGGVPDGGSHPYVAMILMPGATQPVCTGVLVGGPAGDVVLTAAHCLFHNGLRTGTGVRVSFAPTWTPGAATVTGSFYVDPLYDPSQSLTHDLAAIVLTHTPAIPAARLAPVGLTTTLVGSDVETIGTGQPYEGSRRDASETVVGRTGQWLDLSPDNGNSCDGDSGGPDLLAGTDTVVALTDQGSCTADQDQRVDTVEAAAFVASAPQWPSHQPLVASHLSRTATRPHEAVALQVRVSPLYAGETATRQELTHGRWEAADVAKVNLAGLVTFTLTPSRRGTARERVVLPPVATHPAGVSPVSLLLVR